MIIFESFSNFSNFSNSESETIQNNKDNGPLAYFICESNRLFQEINSEIIYITGIHNNLKLEKIHELILKFKNLFFNYIDSFNSLALKIYEPQLRKYESDLRNYVRLNLLYKAQKEAMENKFKILQQKNIEYEQLKKITNAVFENGEFVFYDKKENEILILRTENSNLKNELLDLEKKLQIKEEKYKELIEEFNLTKKMLQNKINDLTYNKNDTLDKFNSNSSILNLNDLSHSNLINNNNSNSEKTINILNSSIRNLKMTKINTSNCFPETKPIKIYSPTNHFISNKKLIKNGIKETNSNLNQRNSNKKINNEYTNTHTLFEENISKNFISPIKRVIDTLSSADKKEKKKKIKNINSKVKSNLSTSHKNKKKNNVQLYHKDVNTLFMNSKTSVNNFLIYRNVLSSNSSTNSITNNNQTLNNGYFTIRYSPGNLDNNKENSSRLNNNSNHSNKSINYLFKK